MQQIDGELKPLRAKKNTPFGVQLLRAGSSVSTQLNKEETLSAVGKVLPSINPDGVQARHTGRSLQAFVYVLSRGVIL